jgi:hypothetical protein
MLQRSWSGMHYFHEKSIVFKNIAHHIAVAPNHIWRHVIETILRNKFQNGCKPKTFWNNLHVRFDTRRSGEVLSDVIAAQVLDAHFRRSPVRCFLTFKDFSVDQDLQSICLISNRNRTVQQCAAQQFTPTHHHGDSRICSIDIFNSRSVHWIQLEHCWYKCCFSRLRWCTAPNKISFLAPHYLILMVVWFITISRTVKTRNQMKVQTKI